MVDADASADGHQVDLDVGSNTITVKVTAEDGTTTRTYTVTVTRAAPPASSDVVTVPADWTLKPSGRPPAAHRHRDDAASSIDAYDSHVTRPCRHSEPQLFKVLASTAVAARDHTETTYTSADKGVTGWAAPRRPTSTKISRGTATYSETKPGMKTPTNNDGCRQQLFGVD